MYFITCAAAALCACLRGSTGGCTSSNHCCGSQTVSLHSAPQGHLLHTRAGGIHRLPLSERAAGSSVVLKHVCVLGQCCSCRNPAVAAAANEASAGGMAEVLPVAAALYLCWAHFLTCGTVTNGCMDNTSTGAATAGFCMQSSSRRCTPRQVHAGQLHGTTRCLKPWFLNL